MDLVCNFDKSCLVFKLIKLWVLRLILGRERQTYFYLTYFVHIFDWNINKFRKFEFIGSDNFGEVGENLSKKVAVIFFVDLWEVLILKEFAYF